MNNSFLTRIFSLLFILSFSFQAFSQSAVQVIPSVLPPYSTLLSEYYRGDQTRLSVTLLNTDAAEPFLQGYLRISIEGQGVKLQSVPFGNYPTIDLMTGAPVTVSQSDLAPYFSPQHLQGNGAGNQNRLPEGYYQFCFEVLEKNTGRLIGSKQCAQAYLTLSDPAFLVLPEKGKVISYANPFNLLFQWTPRHINILNSEYEFTLVEIWDEGIAPEAAFYTAKPIYTTTTNTSNLFYGPAEPQLIMGKKYAWRVRTKVTTSNNELEPFKNDGYSEIFWFKLQGECPPLQKANVVADPRTNKTTLSWISDPVNIGGVKLDYRKKGTANWKTLEAESNQVTLTGLAWSTDYEYQLGNRCVITDDFAYGSVQSFRTLNQDTSNCLPAPAQPLSNQEPLAALKAGDVIFVADFAMRLTSVIGANGNFSGEGAVGLLVPTTTTVVGVKATFTNISVNTDYRVFAGKIVSKYDATESNVGNLDPITKGGGGVGNVKTGTTTAITVNTTIDPLGTAVITETSDTTYTVSIPSKDGQPVTITTKKLPVTVQDKTGKIYTIDKDGKITPAGQASLELLAGKTPSQLNQLSPDQGKITFEAYAEQVYAFDPYIETYGNSSYFDQEYENLNGYRVGSQLLVENSTDKIMATLSGAPSAVKEGAIHFITGKGVEFAATKKGDTYEITLLSGPAKDAQELYAIYRDEDKIKADPAKKAEYTYSLGKLKIATYGAKVYTVKLVPIDGANANEVTVAENLNKVYNPIGVTWNVILAEGMTNEGWNDDQKLDISGAGNNNKYSAEMQKLNAYYKTEKGVDAKTPYLFIFKTEPAGGKANVEGDMLRNRQFGYLFPSSKANLAGHELAHGFFHLEHTFASSYYLSTGDLPQNLMNYNDGKELIKFQWDVIHAPGMVFGMFENEGDAESAVVGMRELASFANPDKTFTFIAPSGKLITIPSNVISVKFSTGDNWDESQYIVPVGTLMSFTTGDGEFFAKGGAASLTFLGYSSGDKIYYDTYSSLQKIEILKPIVGVPCFDEGVHQFRVFKIDYSNLGFDADRKTEKYLAAGKYADFDLLMDKSSLTSNGYVKFNQELGASKYVIANMSSLDYQAQNFIEAHTEEANCSAGGSAYFVYMHAQQIQKYPIVWDLCATQFLLDNPDYLVSPDITSYDKIEYQTIGSIRDNLTVAGFQQTVDAGHRIMVSPPDYKKMGEELKTLLDELHSAEAGTIEGITSILNKLDLYECVLNTMSIDTRLTFLSKIIDAGDDTHILRWIKNTPPNQRKGLVDYFAANNGAIQRAWNNLDGVELDEFINIITHWYLAENNINKDLYKTVKPNPILSANNSTNYIILKDFGLDNRFYPDNLVLGNEITTQLSSNVVITDITTNFPSPGNQDGTYPILQKFTGTPFELIVLGAGEGIEEYPDPFPKDTRILVPAIYAHWLIHRHNVNKGKAKVTIALESIALIASLGEASIPIAVIEAVVSTTNIVLTINQQALLQNSDCAAFMEVWNVFDNIYSGVGVLKLVGSTKQFTLAYDNIKSKYSSLSSVDRKSFASKLNDLAAKLGRLSSSAASTSQNAILGSKNIIILGSTMLINDVTQFAVSNYRSLTQFSGNQIKAIITSSAINHSVATTTLKTDGSILLDQINWSTTIPVTKIGAYTNVYYVNKSGVEVIGDLDIVKASDDVVFLRLKGVESLGAGVKLVDELSLGNFVKKIGDYDVFENGKVFYRTISKEDYAELLKTGVLKGTGECTTSPFQTFSESYLGMLVEFKVARGTIERLEEIGIAARNSRDVLLKHPSLKPDISPWNNQYARFKLEGGQVNIALGQGEALKRFNEGIIEYKFINEIVKP